MKNRFVIINHNAKLYQRATKKVKTQMLNELFKLLHMNRQYLAGLLRNAGKVIYRKGKAVIVANAAIKELSKRGRKKIYGDDVLKILKRLWHISGFVSSKHLVGFIRLNHDKLFNHPELKNLITDSLKQQILRISASSVDRLLKPYRDKLKLKRRYRGNPFSSNLKKSIAVESWFDRPKIPGYVEIDLSIIQWPLVKESLSILLQRQRFVQDGRS